MSNGNRVRAQMATILTIGTLVTASLTAPALHIDYGPGDFSEASQYETGASAAREAASVSPGCELAPPGLEPGFKGQGGLCYLSEPVTGSGCAPVTSAGLPAGGVRGCSAPGADVWHRVQFKGQETGTVESGTAKIKPDIHSIRIDSSTGWNVYYRALTAYWVSDGHLTWEPDSPLINDINGGTTASIGTDVNVPSTAACNNLSAGNFGNSPDTSPSISSGDPATQHTICAG